MRVHTVHPHEVLINVNPPFTPGPISSQCAISQSIELEAFQTLARSMEDEELREEATIAHAIELSEQDELFY
jgi:hypothetical protein